MSYRNVTISRLRTLKWNWASAGGVRRLLVPLVEVCEFLLSHGLREVVTRARLRLTGRSTFPHAAAAPTPYVPPPADDSLTGELTIPPVTGRFSTSIVIPVLNNPDLTFRCLQSIIEHTVAGTYEVIVVDNGSAEPTQQMLARVNGLHVIRNDANVGFVGACNQGAEAGTGEFVLFLNNDTVVQPRWLDALVDTFRRDASAGAVGSKLIYPNGRLQEAGGIIWQDGDGWNYGRNEDPDAPEFNYVREVDYCSGASLAVRRSLFQTLGGFDDYYAPAYYEDTDLAFRLRALGFRVIYQPASRVIHFEGATAGTNTASGLKSYQVINHRKFRERHATALTAQHPHDPSLLRSARDRRSGRRILLVDHMVPHHDQDAGSVRMMALLTILVELGYRVTFLPDNLAPIQPYTSDLQQLGVEVLYGPFANFEFVKERCSEFDIAILCRARFAERYLPSLLDSEQRPFIIFDTIDLHHLREERLAALLKDAALVKSAAETRTIELGVIRSSDMVWVTSTHEATLLRDDRTLPAVEIVPMIHNVRNDVPAFSGRRNILFIGGFQHPPNEDGVLWFINDVMPLIRAELPGVQFIIVGSQAPRSVLKLQSDDVVVKGFVRDIEPIFDSCRVSVAPLRYGAGVKGKVTQSLAWGLPVVATPVAAEGIGMVDGDNVMIATDAADFARRVIQVYRDETVWSRLSQNGRRYIEGHLSHEAIRVSLGGIMERAAATADRTNGEFTSARVRRFAQNQEIDRLRREKERLRAELAAIENQLARKETTIEYLLASRSWRLTSLLRALDRWLHGRSAESTGKGLAVANLPLGRSLRVASDVTGFWGDGWAGSRMSFRTTVTRQIREVCITGLIPDGIDTQSLRLRIDGQEWTRQLPTGGFDWCVPLVTTGRPTVVQFAIEAGRTWQPSAPGSGDSRELAWFVVEIEGR